MLKSLLVAAPFLLVACASSSPDPIKATGPTVKTTCTKSVHVLSDTPPSLARLLVDTSGADRVAKVSLVRSGKADPVTEPMKDDECGICVGEQSPLLPDLHCTAAWWVALSTTVIDKVTLVLEAKDGTKTESVLTLPTYSYAPCGDPPPKLMVVRVQEKGTELTVDNVAPSLRNDVCISGIQK